MTLKTKTVSEQLDVNPTTVQRWVKYFNIPCERNEHGHYMFTESDLLLLKNIQEQLKRGLSMSQVRMNIQPESPKVDDHASQALSSNQVLKKFEKIVMKVDQIEKQLEEKADDVVTIQILQHRHEIDDLLKKIIKLEEEIEMLKEQSEGQEVVVTQLKEKKIPKKRRLASIISLF